jgi:hypothetical protein
VNRIDKAMEIRAICNYKPITSQELIDTFCPGNYGSDQTYMAFQKNCIQDCQKCWESEVKQDAE